MEVTSAEAPRRQGAAPGGSATTRAATRVIASAILDRILHHATKISIRGDSYRPKDKLKSGAVKPMSAANGPDEGQGSPETQATCRAVVRGPCRATGS